MEKVLEAAKGRVIKEIKPVHHANGELWAFDLHFEDGAQLNVYMCVNAETYLDVDFKENGSYL